MSKLLKGLTEKLTIGRTENNAITFSSTLNKNLDFFALASSKRERISEALKLFIEALEEDFRLAILNLFYLRDIRHGNGERNIFCQCLERIPRRYLTNPDFIRLIPEYGRWDDIHRFILHSNDYEIKKTICDVIWNQLQKDLESDSPSLCAKWFPLPNSVKNKARKIIGKKIIEAIFGFGESHLRKMRKIITKIRKKYNLVETNLTNQTYEKIRYDFVPSRAFIIHKDNFLKKDTTRFKEFLDNVRKGEKKINSSCIYPYEIVYRVLENPCDKNLNDIWESIPKIQTDENILTVVDGSNSMYYYRKIGFDARTHTPNCPIHSAIGLGIYTAENNTGFFKDHIITYSESPKLVHIPSSYSILEKIKTVQDACQGLNTNIENVFKLILDTAIQNRIPEEEMPSSVLIISDMEFDSAQNKGKDCSNFQKIEQLYNNSNYKRPHLIFWNVNSIGSNIPVRKNQQGVTLISGLSPNILKFICGSNNTPEDFMKNILLSERYFPILDIIQ